MEKSGWPLWSGIEGRIYNMAGAIHPESIHRRNMVHRTGETWRPPLFSPPGGQLASLAAAFRRFLDLQAGSIWRDLTRILPQAEGTIVDVGCGAQPYRSIMPREARYIGIDTVDAKAHFGYEVPDTRYFEGDRWPIEDASANLVLCTETLEHVPEPKRFLDEACRCLALGGTLVITVPFAARWHFIPYDYWRFTPSCLDRILRDSGFTNVRVYARGNALTVACYKTMALILRLALPDAGGTLIRLLLQLLSIPFLPLLIVLAALANLSLSGDGGDDCLGYTALAERKPL
jgi:SAM-dependent methyltransferase